MLGGQGTAGGAAKSGRVASVGERMIMRASRVDLVKPYVLTLCILFSFFPLGARGLAPDDAGLAVLLAARATAEGQVSTGDHAGALDSLLQSLRDADPARAELADAAYGNGQMVSYVLLHVMPEPAAYAYLANGFHPTSYETDKLLKALCTIAIGLAEEEKTAQTREVTYLTSSENHIVRAMAMYFLSNPYFYENTDFTGQYAEQLSTDYPDLELTQTSLNLALYAKRERADIPELAEEISQKSIKNLPFQPWSESLRSRIQASAKNLTGKARLTRAEAMEPLLQGATQARDWHERHFVLLIMKYELDGPLAGELRDVTRQLSRRTRNTPDVLQARALLATSLGADCVQDRGNEALKDEAFAAGEVLLEGGVGQITPERVMWETWAYGVRDCAKSLAAAGHTDEAIQLFTGLSEKLPGSKIAAECDQARNDLFHTKPLLLENNSD